MPKRTDANQQAIMDGLRMVGASVTSLHTVGEGCPDLLVGFRGRNHLMEVKVPGVGKLTKCQRQWHEDWRGTVDIVTCIEEALHAIGCA